MQSVHRMSTRKREKGLKVRLIKKKAWGKQWVELRTLLCEISTSLAT